MHLLSTSDSSPPMTGNAATKPDVDALAIAHGHAVFRAAFRVIGDRSQAEDIQQNVFVRLIEKPPRQPIENWKSYLCAMSTRAAIDEIRRSQRWQRLTGPRLASRVSPEPQPGAALDDQRTALTTTAQGPDPGGIGVCTSLFNAHRAQGTDAGASTSRVGCPVALSSSSRVGCLVALRHQMS